jgi:hypothetical protein
MAMPLRTLEPGYIGAWLAVPKTQTDTLNSWIIYAADY